MLSSIVCYTICIYKVKLRSHISQRRLGSHDCDYPRKQQQLSSANVLQQEDYRYAGTEVKWHQP